MIRDGGPGPAARAVEDIPPRGPASPAAHAAPPAIAHPGGFGAASLRAAALVAAGVVALALAVALDPPRRAAGADVYTIPPGTADRVARGLPVGDVLPARIDTEVGRALVVVNEDTTDHVFGPMVLAPGQRWERRFAVPGDYALTCSVYPETGFTIGVQGGPEPGGLAASVHGALTLGWLAATALVAGWLAVAVAAPAGMATIARDRARGGLWLLAALALVAALGGVAAMSRVVPWSSAWQVPQSVGAWFQAAWVLVASAFAWRLLRPVPSGAAPKADYLVAAGAALLWPAAQAGAGPGGGPIGLVLALLGAGVVAALVAEGLRPSSGRGDVGRVAGVVGALDDPTESDAAERDPLERSVRGTRSPAGTSSARWEASVPWLLAAAAALVLATLPVVAVPARAITGIVGAALAAALLASGGRRAPWPPARRMVVALAVLAVVSGGLRLVGEVGRIHGG